MELRKKQTAESGDSQNRGYQVQFGAIFTLEYEINRLLFLPDYLGAITSVIFTPVCVTRNN